MQLLISAMEFAALVWGEEYRFSFLNNNSVLVSGRQGDYILYKAEIWRCADEVSPDMVEELGEVIDAYMPDPIRGKRNSAGEAAPPGNGR